MPGGAGGDVLFLVAQMSQNPIDDLLVLNTRNDTDRTTASAANFNARHIDCLQTIAKEHMSGCLGAEPGTTGS